MVETGKSVIVSAQGGIPPYVLNATGGSISERKSDSIKITAPNSETTITATVTDSEGNVATKAIEVYSPIKIDPQSLMIEMDKERQFTASGGKGSYFYSTTCGDNTISSATGFFKAPKQEKTCQVSVSFNSAGASGTSTASVQITKDFTMAVNSVEMMVGNTIDLKQVMSGGSGVYTCTNVSSSTLTGSGDLTGCSFKAKTVGSAKVRIADQSVGSMSFEVSINIQPALTLIPATRIIAINNTLPFTTSGGVGKKTLKITSGNGTINGLNYTAGSVTGNVTVEVSDSFIPPNKVTAAIKVNPALTISPIAGYVRTNNEIKFTASGGDEDYTFSLDSTTFATINSSTGLVTAKTTANPVDVQVRVKDGMNNLSTTMLTIVPELKISPARIALAVNSPKFTFQATGGKANYNFSLPGAKGTMTSDAATGKFSFTPSADEENLTLSVTDATGQTATAHLIIYKPLLITPDPLTIKVGETLSSISISGGIKNPTGQPPYTLALDTTEFGNITGNNPYTFTATNKSGVAKLTVTDNPEFAVSNVTKDIKVLADLPKSLQLSGVDTMKAGECQPYTITLIDQFGNIANANNKQYNFNLGVSLKTATGESVANNGSYYVDDACSLAGTSTFIDSTSTSRIVYFKSARSGVVTLTATHTNAGSVGVNLANAKKDVTVTVNVPTKLVFITQPPATTEMYELLQPAIQVGIADIAGNILADRTDSITLSLDVNPSNARLEGSLKVTAMNGKYSFNDLKINNYGVGFKLKAVSGTLTAAISNPFNIQATSRVIANAQLIPSDGSAIATINVYPRYANGDPVGAGKKVQLVVTVSGNNPTGAPAVNYNASIGSVCEVADPGGKPCIKMLDVGGGNYVAQMTSSVAGTVAQLQATVLDGISGAYQIAKTNTVEFDSRKFETIVITVQPKLNSNEIPYVTINKNGTATQYANFSTAGNAYVIDSSSVGRNIYIKGVTYTDCILAYRNGSSNLHHCNPKVIIKSTSNDKLGHVYFKDVYLGQSITTSVEFNSISATFDGGQFWQGSHSGVSATTMNLPACEDPEGCGNNYFTFAGLNSNPISKKSNITIGDYKNPIVRGISSRNGNTYTLGLGMFQIRSDQFCTFINDVRILYSTTSMNIQCGGIVLNSATSSNLTNTQGRIALSTTGDETSFIWNVPFPKSMANQGILNKYVTTGNNNNSGAGTMFFKHRNLDFGMLLVSQYRCDSGAYSAGCTAGENSIFDSGVTELNAFRAKIKAIDSNTKTITFDIPVNSDPNLDIFKQKARDNTLAMLKSGYENLFKDGFLIAEKNFDRTKKPTEYVQITANTLNTVQVTDVSSFKVGDVISSIYLFDYLDMIQNGILRTEALIYVDKVIEGCTGVSCQTGSSMDRGLLLNQQSRVGGVLTKINNATESVRLGSGVFAIPNLTNVQHDFYGTATVYVDKISQNFNLKTIDNVKLYIKTLLSVTGNVEVTGNSQLNFQDAQIAGNFSLLSASAQVNSFPSSIIRLNLTGNLMLDKGLMQTIGGTRHPDLPSFSTLGIKPLGHGGNGGFYSSTSVNSLNTKIEGTSTYDDYRDPQYPGINSGGIWVNAQDGDCANNSVSVQINVPKQMYNATDLTYSPSAGGTINFKCRSFSGNGGAGQFRIFDNSGWHSETYSGAGRIALIATGTKNQFTGSWTLPTNASELTNLRNKFFNFGFFNSNYSSPSNPNFSAPIQSGTSRSNGRGGAGTIYFQASDMPSGFLLVDQGLSSQLLSSGITDLAGLSGTVSAVDSATKTVTLTLNQPLTVGDEKRYKNYFFRAVGSGTPGDVTTDKVAKIVDHNLTQFQLSSVDGFQVNRQVRFIHQLDYLAVLGNAVLRTSGDLYVKNTLFGDNTGSPDKSGILLMNQNQVFGALNDINSPYENKLEVANGSTFILDKITAQNFIQGSVQANGSQSYLFVRDEIAVNNLTVNRGYLISPKMVVNNEMVLGDSNSTANVLITKPANVFVTTPSNSVMTNQSLWLDIAVGGKITVYNDALLNGSSVGYNAKCTTGNPQTSGMVRAFGGQSNLGTVQPVTDAAYGNLRNPTELPCNGSTLVRVQSSSEININGMIESYGGSIILNAPIVSGSGVLTVEGYANYLFGGGITNGGRIAIKANQLKDSFIIPTSTGGLTSMMNRIRLSGNESSGPTSGGGGAGTYYVETTTYPNGVLFVYNKLNGTYYEGVMGHTPLIGFDKIKITGISGNTLTLASQLPYSSSDFYKGIVIRNLNPLKNNGTVDNWSDDARSKVVASTANTLTIENASQFAVNDEIRPLYVFDMINVAQSGVISSDADLYVNYQFLNNESGSVANDGIIFMDKSHVGGAIAPKLNNGKDLLVIDSGSFAFSSVTVPVFKLNGGIIRGGDQFVIQSQFTQNGGNIYAQSMKVVGDYQLNKGLVSTNKLEVTGNFNLGGGVQTSLVSLPTANTYGSTTTLDIKVDGQLNMKSNSIINASFNYGLTGISSDFTPVCLGGGSLGGESGKFIMPIGANYSQASSNYPYHYCNVASSKSTISYDNLRSPRYSNVPYQSSYWILTGVGSIQIYVGQSCTIANGKINAFSHYVSSGGTIKMNCQSMNLSGSNIMNVSGGAGGVDRLISTGNASIGGAGGGGRVALINRGPASSLIINETESSSSLIQAYPKNDTEDVIMNKVFSLNGGMGYFYAAYNIFGGHGGAGTLYIQTTDFPNGILYVSNKNSGVVYSGAELQNGTTRLPSTNANSQRIAAVSSDNLNATIASNAFANHLNRFEGAMLRLFTAGTNPDPLAAGNKYVYLSGNSASEFKAMTGYNFSGDAGKEYRFMYSFDKVIVNGSGLLNLDGADLMIRGSGCESLRVTSGSMVMNVDTLKLPSGCTLPSNSPVKANYVK